MNDGIFTTIKVVHGVPLFLEKHAQRLRRRYNSFKLTILDYTTENHLTNAALRVDVFESGEMRYAVRSLPESGILVTALTVIPSSSLPTVKQRERFIYKQAQAVAKEKGFDTVLFSSPNGFLLESPISNIISLDENGDIITPPLPRRSFSECGRVFQGLRGIMRQVLLEGNYIKEKEIAVDTPGPLVLINCLRVQGVTHVNGRRLVDSRDLMEDVQRIIEKEERAYVL